MGYIYLVTNKTNGKSYVGKTIRPLSERRAGHFNSGHCRSLHSDLKKYGKEAFNWEILFESDDKELLGEKEKAFIAKYQTLAPNGYNLTTGGKTPKISEETRKRYSASGRKRWSDPRFAERNARTREKMRIGIRKKWQDPKHREKVMKILAEVNARPERRENVSRGILRKYAIDPDYCRRRKEAIIAKTQTQEWLTNNRNAAKKRRKKVLCVETGITYLGTQEAAKATNTWDSNISAVCNGKLKTTGGYHWRYA